MYKNKTLAQRRAHHDLATKCTFGPKSRSGGMYRAKKNLRKLLGITKADVKGMQCCHLCECDSDHGCCTNPQHVYFGSQMENTWDAIFGHFNHPTITDFENPKCPLCNWQSDYKGSTRGRRRRVKNHIGNSYCIKRQKADLF